VCEVRQQSRTFEHLLVSLKFISQSRQLNIIEVTKWPNNLAHFYLFYGSLAKLEFDPKNWAEVSHNKMLEYLVKIGMSFIKNRKKLKRSILDKWAHSSCKHFTPNGIMCSSWIAPRKVGFYLDNMAQSYGSKHLLS
jgi:hypothetical protein